MKEEQLEEICGHCVSYDLWCGICLNPQSKLFDTEAEEIFDYPCCKLFEIEESYKKQDIQGELSYDTKGESL